MAAIISKNKNVIIEGRKKVLDCIGFLSSFFGALRMAKNRIGYVINIIKKMLTFNSLWL